MTKSQVNKLNRTLAYCGICAKELCYGDIAYAFVEGTIVDKNYEGWNDLGKEFAPLIDCTCHKCWDKVLKKLKTLAKLSTEERIKLKAQAKENGFVFRVKRIE